MLSSNTDIGLSTLAACDTSSLCESFELSALNQVSGKGDDPQKQTCKKPHPSAHCEHTVGQILLNSYRLGVEKNPYGRENNDCPNNLFQEACR